MAVAARGRYIDAPEQIGGVENARGEVQRRDARDRLRLVDVETSTLMRKRFESTKVNRGRASLAGVARLFCL